MSIRSSTKINMMDTWILQCLACMSLGHVSKGTCGCEGWKKLLSGKVCLSDTETIEHVYIECVNARQLWRDTEHWLRILRYPHFKISDTEKVFGKK